jgi:glycosyltransferase involved in cell wall biosynthesis
MSNALPLVSVVIETITARYDVAGAGSMADDLAATLTGLEHQTYPRELIEAIVVLDGKVPATAADEVRRRFPFVRITESREANYYAAKNAGAEAARGSVVALLDGDCEPDVNWAERLVSRLEPGVAAVSGRTRYAAVGLQARTLSVPDFAFVIGDPSGRASGMNLNNVAFRRDVLREHPLDARLRRNGGCYFLYHQLRAAGREVVYEPDAIVAHAVDDIRGRQFVHKHFGRGYDGVAVYRLDDRFVLRGTRIFRRFGAAGLVAISAQRILRDWLFIARHRKQIGVPAPAVPYFGVVIAGTRVIELAGMIAAVVDPDRYSEPSTAATTS